MDLYQIHLLNFRKYMEKIKWYRNDIRRPTARNSDKYCANGLAFCRSFSGQNGRNFACAGVENCSRFLVLAFDFVRN